MSGQTEYVDLKGEFRICLDYELQDLTASGWRLVAVIRDQCPMQAIDQEKDTGNFRVLKETARCVIIERVRFLMRLEPDEVVAHARAKQRAAEHESKSVTEALWLAQAEAKSAADKLAVAEKRADDEAAENTVYRNQIHRVSEQNRAYERDIAKIRTAVGDLRMREILADGSNPPPERYRDPILGPPVIK